MFTYDPAGNRLTKALENGIATSYIHDDAGRLVSVDNGAAGRFDYTYNAVNNVTRKALTLAGHVAGVEDYSYDAVDQVAGAKYGTNTVDAVYDRIVSYAYDPAGNRAAVADNGAETTYTANALNQYTAVSGMSALAHDANGNLAGCGEWSYSYDAQNRLIEAAGGTNRMVFAYDARNRCVERTTYAGAPGAWVENGRTRLTYDRWSLIEERDGSETLQASYVHGPVIDEILCEIRSGGAVFHSQDMLGSTVALSDEAGQVVERYGYDVFGKVSVRDGSGHPTTNNNQPTTRFLFTGREWLVKIGLYDYRHRVYSAELGRFLQADPIRFAAGDGNLYRYVGNLATGLADPYGLCPSPGGPKGPGTGGADKPDPQGDEDGDGKPNIDDDDDGIDTDGDKKDHDDPADPEDPNKKPEKPTDSERCTELVDRFNRGDTLTPEESQELKKLYEKFGKDCMDKIGWAQTALGIQAAFFGGIAGYESGRFGLKGGELTHTSPGKTSPDFRGSPTGHHGGPTGNFDPKGGMAPRLPHYHRRPGIGKHRPWEGGP